MSTTSTRISPIGPIVAAGGAAALSWEVVWQIEASLSLGVSALATAIVLAATMAGMACGALLAGRLLEKRPIARPLRLYGCLELLIGCAGLAMPFGFALLERIDTLVFGVAPALAPAAHALGMLLLIGPATCAMGATVPLFQLVARESGFRISSLYGLNTAGAAFGALAVALVLLPTLGVQHSVFAIAGVNFGVFALTWLMPPLRVASPVDLEGPARPEPVVPIAFSTAVWLVFGTGFATFALEVAWFRSLRAAYQSTTDSFAILLASVLIPLALGARLVPALRRRGVSLGLVLLAAAVALLVATPLVERIDLLAPKAPDFFVHVALRLALALCVMGPTMLGLGVVLPWMLEDFPDPKRSARLYAVNTAGCVLGSLLAAWLLLPSVGFAATAWGVGTGIALLSLRAASWRVLPIAATGLALLFAVQTSAGLGRTRAQGMSEGFGPYRIVAFEEGPDSTVSVLETVSGRRHLLIDGFVATSEFSAADYMEWMGRLPMLLHPDPRTALVICFGTGRTANAVRAEGPEHLDVVDVSAAVLALAPLFPSNEGVLDDPRVESHVMDGRAWLRRTDRRYDVVTLEPMPPNFAGMNALYSLEFYEIIASRLAPGGIVAQWLPIHLMGPDDAVSAAATFREVFPDSALWLDPIHGTGILLGRREAQPHPLGESWPGFARNPGKRPLSEENVLRALALEPAAFARYARADELIRDDNQRLAYGRFGRHPQPLVREVQENVRRIADARGSYPFQMKPQNIELEVRALPIGP